MADVITRFKLETTQFDSKLRDSARSLSDLTGKLMIAGKDFDRFASKNVEAARALGSIQSGATNTKDKVKDLVGAFNDVARAYNQLTKEQQQTDFGKAMAGSLEQLKGRIGEAKQELYSMGDGAGDLKGILTSLGSELGINSQLMSVVTAGTIGYTAAITAAAAATVAATKAWADYNTELSKQTNAAMVTTGLNGEDLNRLVDSSKAIADIYGVDFREVVNAANTLITQFGKSGDEAMQLIRDGMQGMIEGDGGKLLSMIQQYAPAFRDAGIEASQLVAIIQNSEGGLFTQENMSAIVMGIRNIRQMKDSTKNALREIGVDADEMSRKLNDGTMSVFDALREVSGAIDNVGSGSKAAGDVMQNVFGRQGTMAGTKLGEAIANLNTNLEETKNQTGAVGQSMANLELANERLNKALRETFGYDGWAQMATGIKTMFVGALAEAVTEADKLRDTIYEISGIDPFSVMISSATQALGPLGQVLDTLRKIAGIGQLQQEGINGKITTGGVAGIIANHTPSAEGTGDSPEVAALKAEIKRLQDALNNANKPKGGGKTGTAWAPVEMQSYDFSAISLGRSKEDIKKDIAKWQKEDATAKSVEDSIAAQAKVKKYQDELAARIAMENPTAEAYKYDFSKDMKEFMKMQTKEDKTSKEAYAENLKNTSAMVSGIQQLVGGMEMLGVELPEGFDKMFGGLQGIITILEAIQTIQTVGTFMGIFHNGGIVPHAATGMVIPGKDYADRTPVLASAGEVILNKAQQGNLVAQLEGGNRGGDSQGTPYVEGEKIYLGINNFLRRSGRGEIVTSRR